VGNLHRAYSAALPRVRRRINQAIFKRILVSSDGDIIRELRSPFDLLLRASGTADRTASCARQPKTNREPPRRPAV